MRSCQEGSRAQGARLGVSTCYGCFRMLKALIKFRVCGASAEELRVLHLGILGLVSVLNWVQGFIRA